MDAMTRYSPVLAHTEVLRSSKIDMNQPDCPGFYSDDYRTADVRWLPLTHRGDCNYPGSKYRTHEGVEVVNLIDILVIFDEKEKLQSERLAKLIATSVGDGFRAASTAGEELSSVVNDDVEKIRGVVSVGEVVGKGPTVNSRYLPNREDMRVPALAGRKARNAPMTATKAVDVYAPTNANEVGRVPDAMSEGRSLSDDRSGSVLNAYAPSYLQTRSSQAADYIDVVSKEDLVVEKPSEVVADVVGKDACLVPSEICRIDSRSLASVVSSSGVDDADMLALYSRIQELHAENEYSLSLRAWNQKVHID